MPTKSKKAKPLPSVEELNRMFRYDRKTGKLYWRYRADWHARTNTWLAGKEAGTDNGSGYLVIKLNQRMIFVHRIVFKMLHGYAPQIVDHEDLDGSNNRPKNLRDAKWHGNWWNKRKFSKKKLPKGVFHGRPGKFRAIIAAKGERIDLGTFSSIAEAEAAYQGGARQFHAEFARF